MHDGRSGDAVPARFSISAPWKVSAVTERRMNAYCFIDDLACGYWIIWDNKLECATLILPFAFNKNFSRM